MNAGFDVYDDRFGDGFGPVDIAMPERPASEVVPLAREWIAGRNTGAAASGQDAGPWFAWVHVFDPHAPYQPPPPFDTQYAGKPYYGEVAATDAALAPLLEDVRSSARPTLVIVTSDHGEGLGDHGEEAHGIFAYESTLRVPLIIASLGGQPAASKAARQGEVSQVAARHVDILPTILDAVGQPVPDGLPGRTLLPRKEREAGSAPRTAYFEAMSGMLNNGWAPLAGVIVDRDKFIDLPIAERFDLAADPAERSNLYGRSPERDRTLAAALTAFAPALPGQRAAEDPAAAASLRALGYVSGGASPKAKYTEADDPKRLIDLDAAIHRALEAFSAGRMEESAQLYWQMIDRRPDMEIAYRHLAFIDYQRGHIDAAIDVLQRALAAGVTDPRVQALLGEYLSDAGQIAEGIRILEPLAADPAANADVLNALGVAYARASRPEDARRMFERLIEAMPGSGGPFENLGVLALGQGDVAGAEQVLRPCSRRRPTFVARARGARRRRLRARRPDRRLPVVGACHRARSGQLRRAVQPGRQPGARRPHERRAAVPGAVPAGGSAGALCRSTARGLAIAPGGTLDRGSRFGIAAVRGGLGGGRAVRSRPRAMAGTRRAGGGFPGAARSGRASADSASPRRMPEPDAKPRRVPGLRSPARKPPGPTRRRRRIAVSRIDAALLVDATRRTRGCSR